MRTGERETIGRRLARTCRHDPERLGLEMDLNGWVDIRELVDALRDKESRRFGRWLRPHHVKAVVECDKKGRYEVRGNTVRATYGHTVEIELDLPTEDIPSALFFPCSDEDLAVIMDIGILPGNRSHVHLSQTVAKAAEAGRLGGQKLRRPVILEIDTAQMTANGDTVWKAGTTVYLAEKVEPQYLDRVEEEDGRLSPLISKWEEEEEE
ncbi:MAG TPA: RNA 2'-phosphotransferase [Candidatus Thalassarchaeaceae archaeon]|nr:RNA 2'-phosphotransferase [Candidatus Thalassarchaeaceae archaeon]